MYVASLICSEVTMSSPRLPAHCVQNPIKNQCSLTNCCDGAHDQVTTRSSPTSEHQYPRPSQYSRSKYSDSIESFAESTKLPLAAQTLLQCTHLV
ncbi:hypothetical protein E2C01_018434 [Portunus trituberculatus]|uniref:Uncharacterized protein n=1 Tax=Portunus trituberculatus TaxID=210409 RepID=A0A5B7DV57_PORTR|nr:hypothetical protein [Portunus trituberculatus]